MLERRVARGRVNEHRARSSAGCALLAGCVLLVGRGCSGANEPRDALALAERARRGYCQHLCSRLAGCESGFSSSACTNACQLEPLARALNAQIWTSQSSCIGRASCAELRDDDLYALCYQQALSELEPSSICIDYCIAEATASFECGGGYSVRACVEGGLCAWNDGVLTDALICEQLGDCFARDRCLSEAFGA